MKTVISFSRPFHKYASSKRARSNAFPQEICNVYGTECAFLQNEFWPFSSRKAHLPVGKHFCCKCAFPHFHIEKAPAGRHLQVPSLKVHVYRTAPRYQKRYLIPTLGCKSAWVAKNMIWKLPSTWIKYILFWDFFSSAPTQAVTKQTLQ